VFVVTDWYYAIFTFFALLMFESTVAYNRLQSLQRLRSHTISQERSIFAYRPAYPPGQNGWTQVLIAELVPGDIVSCKRYTISQRSRRSHQQEQQLNRIPADILVLAGDAVVDEALLTGESIPQLKGTLGEAFNGNLDLQEHKECILFGGTTLLVGNAGETPGEIPSSPDDGVIGMVLRTGFETAQGSLLRTMAHTQKSVDGIHTTDTYVFIFILLCCAVASAGMVLQEGWNDPTRNRFRLLLHVIIIITSVVPPELPMELSLAVTNSVASLMKDCQVYCTEVFRIPLAGQVTICCFDKTGTLTSDEMQLVGVRHLDDSGNFTDTVRPDSELPWPVARIMVACHSLALNTMGGASNKSMNNTIGDPLEKAVLKNTGYQLVQNNALRAVESSGGRPDTILILQRFRFSSKLKRMSVIVQENSSSKIWILSKGAPETIRTLLDPKSMPANYDEISTKHMSLGQRVLAIAYREISKEEVSSSSSLKNLKRDSVESGLLFGGFLLLDCPVKPDSKPVISELSRSGHACYMITGDALLTAASVARKVGIIAKNQSSAPILHQIRRVTDPSGKTVVGPEAFGFFHLPSGSSDDEAAVLKGTLSLDSLARVKELVASGRVALCLSGDTLDELGRCIVESEVGSNFSSLLQKNENQILFHPSAQNFLKELVPLVAVFARHAPRQKEAIIAAFNAAGSNTLMCGDGTNDVGALRRASVGISLISAPEIEAKQRAASEAISRERTQQKKAKKEGKRRVKPATFEESLRQLREAQEELESVELGDASIASPFTSRSASIKCCKDVLQQGRCTLVTMLQIYKILGVNCLVNATVLSKLFLHGVKNGDRQLTILGVGVAMLFFFVTRGKPIRTLSVTRPPSSVLCTQALLSIALQFLVHLVAILLSAQAALAFVDPYDPSMIPDGPFNPNTLNSCTFLVSAIATVNTFAINYRGEPFMESLWQNKLLLRSLQACYAVLFACALEVFPPLNDLLQLTEMPILDGTEGIFASTGSDADTFLQPILHSSISAVGFPGFLALLMVLDTVLALAAERSVLRLFDHS
jgi:cation-transporting ATPase 13A1